MKIRYYCDRHGHEEIKEYEDYPESSKPCTFPFCKSVMRAYEMRD